MSRSQMTTAALTLCLAVMSPGAARGQSDDDQSSLVWFIGTVTDVVNGQASLDLGEVHGLEPADTVAVFRPRDDYFAAMGILTIDETRPVYSIARRTSRFDVQPGDQIVTCRTLQQLGPIEDFRDRFLKRQVLARASQNGYSNLKLADEATILHRFTARQPKWVRDQSRRDNELQPVAGAIRASSVSSNALTEIEPLLEQVLNIQKLAVEGIPVDKLLPADWLAILTVLNPHSAVASAEPETVSADVSVQSPADAPAAAPELSAPAIPVEAIRRRIGEVMFTRSAEEKYVATLICASIEHYAPRHEELWVSQQLRHSQFASLAEDAAWLEEFELVMQKVRQDSK